MNDLETELKTNWIWLNADVETTYKSEIREEECHGIHTFIDQEIIACDVIKVVIRTKNMDIDITKRLTPDELENLKEPFEVEID